MNTGLEFQRVEAKRDYGNHLVQLFLLQIRKMRFGEGRSKTYNYTSYRWQSCDKNQKLLSPCP